MVPGATLPAGSYLFELADPMRNQHAVRILSEDGSRQIALAHAVPFKRMEAKGDLVLKFEPTDAGSPPAIRAWFYPGSLYGHEFIYPEEQARKIAQRTKTIVLSMDASGDGQQGRLRTYDATGAGAEYRGDPLTLREWEEWRSKGSTSPSGTASSDQNARQQPQNQQASRQSATEQEHRESTTQTEPQQTERPASVPQSTSEQERRTEQEHRESTRAQQKEQPQASATEHEQKQASARMSTAEQERSESTPQAQQQQQQQTSTAQSATQRERRESTAPMIQTDLSGIRVELDELEDNPGQYMNQTISVDGEVEEVLGPRLFTLDEPDWMDLEGETLVYLPANFATPVRENDRVTITGTVQPFVRAELEREWGWLGLEPEVEAEIGTKPVLLAKKIVGGNSDVAMIVEVGRSSGRAAGAIASADRPERRPSAAKPAGESAPVTDLATLARGDDHLVGTHVKLEGLEVEKTADRGFFAKTADGSLFVLPAEQGPGSAESGDMVSIEGVVLQMPRDMESRLDGPDDVNNDIYIYATHSSAAGATDQNDR
jgi:hypothetical protein